MPKNKGKYGNNISYNCAGLIPSTETWICPPKDTDGLCSLKKSAKSFLAFLKKVFLFSKSYILETNSQLYEGKELSDSGTKP